MFLCVGRAKVRLMSQDGDRERSVGVLRFAGGWGSKKIVAVRCADAPHLVRLRTVEYRYCSERGRRSTVVVSYGAVGIIL